MSRTTYSIKKGGKGGMTAKPKPKPKPKGK